ncbi:hypothetical protein T10_10099 [Trichinella papuae]|uniref:Uncharacterized protein n=1 Tax=Trichinella papuae TaxID=268474 RepID=A0A0V1LWZ9_9BILA|nr:hypothetical protein T10_10099 [Trichinella papuae]
MLTLKRVNVMEENVISSQMKLCPMQTSCYLIYE